MMQYNVFRVIILYKQCQNEISLYWVIGRTALSILFLTPSDGLKDLSGINYILSCTYYISKELTIL